MPFTDFLIPIEHMTIYHIWDKSFWSDTAAMKGPKTEFLSIWKRYNPYNYSVSNSILRKIYPIKMTQTDAKPQTHQNENHRSVNVFECKFVRLNRVIFLIYFEIMIRMISIVFSVHCKLFFILFIPKYSYETHYESPIIISLVTVS